MNFDRLDTEDKARKFRKNRLNKINNKGVRCLLKENPYCVVHWLPISKEALFKPDALNPVEFSKFILMQGRVVECTTSIFFKFAFIERFRRRFSWKVQLLHSGALEMAFVLPLYKNNHGKTKQIYPHTLTKILQGTVDKFKEYTLSFGVDAPVLVGISFFNVRGYSFFIVLDSQFYSGDSNTPPRLDIKKIILPGTLIESLENMKEDECKIFDMLWEFFGYDRCPYYNEDRERKNLD